MSRPGGALAVAVGAALLLAGCIAAPVSVEEGAAPPPLGPTLVLEVVNNADLEVAVSYEFESGNAGGGGEGTVPGCEHTSMSFGDVAGTYRVRVDGAQVVEAAVPGGMPGRGYLVIRVIVGPDGQAELGGAARWTEVEPPFTSQRIGGCG